MDQANGEELLCVGEAVKCAAVVGPVDGVDNVVCP